ncbi:hypothetical protein Ocin01_07048 [Orchesella cincta]|uniref:Uncharacterized protein n=1 Tax=Orchesella cincta TaxID=48709 RepID=A0A1D2N3J7_ORCCI|nr:hypothetical protein Ocin01_07048 [Orchesella cincta]
MSSEPVNIPPAASKLTPKSSFSYSHSPQDSNSNNNSGAGGILTAFRGSSNMTSPAVSAITTPVTPGTTSASTPTASVSNSMTSGGSTPASKTADVRLFSLEFFAELKRKPSLHVVLPKFGTQAHGGSSDSLNRSPHSPVTSAIFIKTFAINV